MIIDAVRPFLAACLIALLAITSGAGFGIAFGAFEDAMKDGLKQDATAVTATVYGGDDSKAQAVVSKSWTYYKRAHLHSGVLGTQALVVILLLASLTTVALRLRQAAALASAVGGLGYGWFWYVAGRAAPSLGGTDAAKESLAWLAVPSSGLIVVGLLLTLVCVGLALRPKAS